MRSNFCAGIMEAGPFLARGGSLTSGAHETQNLELCSWCIPLSRVYLACLNAHQHNQDDLQSLFLCFTTKCFVNKLDLQFHSKNERNL